MRFACLTTPYLKFLGGSCTQSPYVKGLLSEISCFKVAFTFKRWGETDSVCTPEWSPKAIAISLFSSPSPRPGTGEGQWAPEGAPTGAGEEAFELG